MPRTPDPGANEIIRDYIRSLGLRQTKSEAGNNARICKKMHSPFRLKATVPAVESMEYRNRRARRNVGFKRSEDFLARQLRCEHLREKARCAPYQRKDPLNVPGRGVVHGQFCGNSW